MANATIAIIKLRSLCVRRAVPWTFGQSLVVAPTAVANTCLTRRLVMRRRWPRRRTPRVWLHQCRFSRNVLTWNRRWRHRGEIEIQAESHRHIPSELVRPQVTAGMEEASLDGSTHIL